MHQIPPPINPEIDINNFLFTQQMLRAEHLNFQQKVRFINVGLGNQDACSTTSTTLLLDPTPNPHPPGSPDNTRSGMTSWRGLPLALSLVQMIRSNC